MVLLFTVYIVNTVSVKFWGKIAQLSILIFYKDVGNLMLYVDHLNYSHILTTGSLIVISAYWRDDLMVPFRFYAIITTESAPLSSNLLFLFNIKLFTSCSAWLPCTERSLFNMLRCLDSCWWAQSSMWELHPLSLSPCWTQESACGLSAFQTPARHKDKSISTDIQFYFVFTRYLENLCLVKLENMSYEFDSVHYFSDPVQSVAQLHQKKKVSGWSKLGEIIRRSCQIVR